MVVHASLGETHACAEVDLITTLENSFCQQIDKKHDKSEHIDGNHVVAST